MAAGAGAGAARVSFPPVSPLVRRRAAPCRFPGRKRKSSRKVASVAFTECGARCRQALCQPRRGQRRKQGRKAGAAAPVTAPSHAQGRSCEEESTAEKKKNARCCSTSLGGGCRWPRAPQRSGGATGPPPWHGARPRTSWWPTPSHAPSRRATAGPPAGPPAGPLAWPPAQWRSGRSYAARMGTASSGRHRRSKGKKRERERWEQAGFR